MPQKLRYRLALDLGSTSLGWAMIRLNAENEPCAVIKAGVRIFSNGREPAAAGKVGASKAETRRKARAMRRRRDRLLKRKNRMMNSLLIHGFFPKDSAARKELELLNPYQLRAKGLDHELKPAEFARALFHINQRRGFKSNRKADKGASDSGALKKAINSVEQALAAYPKDKSQKPKADADWLQWVSRQLPDYQTDKPRTIGEFLNQRFTDMSIPPEQRRVRARNNGEKGGKLIYDLYIDRAMIEVEFEALWARQASFNNKTFNSIAYHDLKDCLLFQRQLRPVKPGRCTLLPNEERAPLALPSQQRFRIYQEVNNLRLMRLNQPSSALTLEQRDKIIQLLERPNKEKKTPHEVSFDQIRIALKLGGHVTFNLEDEKRTSLKGNATSASLSKSVHFGSIWFNWTEKQQDAIVRQICTQQNSARLIRRLMKYCLIDEATASRIADAGLPEGYGSLSNKALDRILPELKRDVVHFAQAVKNAGFDHHSRLNAFVEVPSRTFDTGHQRIDNETGEIKTLYAFKELPYYGEFLQRHVGFSDSKATPEQPEQYFGKIANPTVHIGLNQVRLVVNTLLKKYGHPQQVIVEVANELKRPSDHRPAGYRVGSITKETMRRYCPCAGCINVRQAINQERNKYLRAEAEKILGHRPTEHDMERMKIWDDMREMSGSIVQCPYSGTTLGVEKILSASVEVDHIFPHQKTLDDSLANKVLCVREANRIKKDRSPAQAKDDFFILKGWKFEEMLARVKNWDRSKRFRFQEGAFEEWLAGEKDFLPRALNDTRYLSRVAHEYLSLICPQDTRVIPGKMTAELRKFFGLNDILGLKGEKNRNDHRHHAVDACVIGVTDQGMMQRFAQASASARERQLDKLVDNMPLPWPTYREHCARAVNAIWVSHKPDHGYEAEMFDQTIYNADGFSRSAAKVRSVIPFGARSNSPAALRHVDRKGQPKSYKGLLSNSNYCIEIGQEAGNWIGEVIATYQAYEKVRPFKSDKAAAFKALRNPHLALSGKPLVIRLGIDDVIRAEIDGILQTLRVLKINSSGSITFVKLNETNIPARYTAQLAARKMQAEGKPFDPSALNDDFFQKAINASSLKQYKTRRVTISPIGELRDPGFKE
jgi:CRISPR-associated endonuclease Csn1